MAVHKHNIYWNLDGYLLVPACFGCRITGNKASCHAEEVGSEMEAVRGAQAQ